MSKDKHGLFGGIIKVLMVVIFFIIGGLILATGILGLTTWSKDVEQWVAICNVVFGACLLTSPFFLSHNRGGLNTIIKILMVAIFTAIGAFFIAAGAICQSRYADPKWYYIVDIVFGCLLFTSPFFLRKDLKAKKPKQ